MKIQFDKVGGTAKPFIHTLEDMMLKGTLKKSGFHRVALVSRLEGTLPLVCDRCGKMYTKQISAPLALTLSDEMCKNKEDLDIIEFLDGVIDITYILESEMNLQKSTYHYCLECDNNEEILEIEF